MSLDVNFKRKLFFFEAQKSWLYEQTGLGDGESKQFRMHFFGTQLEGAGIMQPP